jgi:hypothetical protein
MPSSRLARGSRLLERDAVGSLEAPSVVRLAPESKSLAQCGKVTTGYRCYLPLKRRVPKDGKCHEMFESQLQSSHRPCVLSARLVQQAAILFKEM